MVLLLTTDAKRYLVRVEAGRRLHTHLGIFDHQAMIGSPLGSLIHSQVGQPALVLEPGLSDLMLHLRRGTQIIYPKDAAYLTQRLNLRAGSRVIEAGTGSGGLTTALAWAVAPHGMVYTYETRPEIHQMARANLERVGLLSFTTMHQEDIEGGMREHGVDAVFLDVREPWRHLEAVTAALRPAGFFASLLPTTNQVSDLLVGLETHGFVDVAVEELLLRAYKPIPDRLRPDEAMIGHTGFLISARCVPGIGDTARWLPKERQRYQARLKTQAEIAEAARQREERMAQGGRKYPRLPLPD